MPIDKSVETDARGLMSEAHVQADGSVIHVARWPLDVRSSSMAIIAFAAAVYLLQSAKSVFIPLTLSMLLSYALTPLVAMLKRRVRIAEPLGAGAAMILLVSGVAYAASVLQPQATVLLDSVPQATKKLERVLHRTALDKTSAFRKLTVAADEIGKAASRGQSVPSDASSAADAIAGAPPIKLRAYLWSGLSAVLSAFGQTVVVLALTYFLLISKHDLKRRLVKISGHTLSAKKLTVQILDEIDAQIQRYLLIQVGTSALLGLCTGIAFALIGVDNAILWGVTAAVLHLVPYIGTALIVAAASTFAYLQFDSLHTVLLVAGSTLAIAGLIGLGLVPWLTERVGRINAVATFVSLIAWEWLWGVPGLLLGIPIMMATMVVCERIDRLRPLAELLGSDR